MHERIAAIYGGHTDRRLVVKSSHVGGIVYVFWGILLFHPSVRHKGKIALHCGHESLTILFRCDDRRFTLVCTEEARVFDPALQLLVPSICPLVVCTDALVSIGKDNATARTDYAYDQFSVFTIETRDKRIIHDIDV
jgi:hypothetical protein